MSASVIVYRFSNTVNYWFMIRLIRVQVQIMSEKEYTKVIIKKMRQSKEFEWIMLMLLTVNNTILLYHYLLGNESNKSIDQILYNIGYGSIVIIFMSIFYF